jgi:uncharacterized membrane protein YoaK (UPF0700 family)
LGLASPIQGSLIALVAFFAGSFTRAGLALAANNALAGRSRLLPLESFSFLILHVREHCPVRGRFSLATLLHCICPL